MKTYLSRALQVVILIACCFTFSVGIAAAATTIGTDIQTGGTLTVSGTANNLAVQGAATGDPVTLTASGSDSNISIQLAPKGDNGFTQLGPDTYGTSGWAGYNVSTEDYRTTSTEPIVYEQYIESYLGDFADGQIYGDKITAGTQGAGATQDVGTVEGIHTEARSDLPAGRTASDVTGGDMQSFAAGGGTVTDADGIYAQINAINGSTIENAKGVESWIYDISPSADTSTGYTYFGHFQNGNTLHDAYGLWIDNMAGIATNPYYSWFDSQGVRRVKEDSSVDGIGQAIEALYNNQFTKYTPGATNYERLVLGEWNSSNVAEIGTENGGTGSARAMAFITASTTRMTIGADGNVGIGVTNSTVPLQVATPSSNATSTVIIGKTGQNRGSCLELFDSAGTPVYAYVAAGASTFTLSATSCK